LISLTNASEQPPAGEKCTEMALGVTNIWDIFFRRNKKVNAPLKPVPINNHVIIGPP
jgi:hypothetical protein